MARTIRLTDKTVAHYFDPEPFSIVAGGEGLLVDGGVTPLNNPSIALFPLPDAAFDLQMADTPVQVGDSVHRDGRFPQHRYLSPSRGACR